MVCATRRLKLNLLGEFIYVKGIRTLEGGVVMLVVWRPLYGGHVSVLHPKLRTGKCMEGEPWS